MKTAGLTPIRWSALDAIGLWVLQVFGTGLWATLLVAVVYSGDRPETLPLWFLVAGQVVLWSVYGLGPILITRVKGNGPVIDLGARIERWDLPVGIVVGVVLQLAVLPLIYWPILELVDSDPGEVAQELVDRSDNLIGVVLLVLLAVIGAPLAEEFFFRGLLLRGLREWLHPWPAILVSAALFALVHIDPILFPGTFVLGVVAAAATVRTGRLGPAWGMHLGFNASTLVLLLMR